MNILKELSAVCDQVYSVRGEIRLSVTIDSEPKVWAILAKHNEANPAYMYGMSFRTVNKPLNLVEMRLI